MHYHLHFFLIIQLGFEILFSVLSPRKQLNFNFLKQLPLASEWRKTLVWDTSATPFFFNLSIEI